MRCNWKSHNKKWVLFNLSIWECILKGQFENRCDVILLWNSFFKLFWNGIFFLSRTEWVDHFFFTGLSYTSGSALIKFLYNLSIVGNGYLNSITVHTVLVTVRRTVLCFLYHLMPKGISSLCKPIYWASIINIREIGSYR